MAGSSSPLSAAEGGGLLEWKGWQERGALRDRKPDCAFAWLRSHFAPPGSGHLPQGALLGCPLRPLSAPSWETPNTESERVAFCGPGRRCPLFHSHVPGASQSLPIFQGGTAFFVPLISCGKQVSQGQKHVAKPTCATPLVQSCHGLVSWGSPHSGSRL